MCRDMGRRASNMTEAIWRNMKMLSSEGMKLKEIQKKIVEMYGDEYTYSPQRIYTVLQFESWEDRCKEKPHQKRTVEVCQNHESVTEDKLDVIIDLLKELKAIWTN